MPARARRTRAQPPPPPRPPLIPGRITAEIINGVSVPNWWFPTPQGARQPTAPIAGPRPQEVISQVLPDPTRQGSGKLSPLLVKYPGPEKQDLRPSSPFGVNRDQLAAGARELDLEPGQLRRLATLPQQTQLHIIKAASDIGDRDPNVFYARAMDTVNAYALNPGTPAPLDLEEILGEEVQYLRGVPFTKDTIDDARAMLVGPAGPDAPVPDEEDLFEQALDLHREAFLETDIFYPLDRGHSFSFESVAPSGEGDSPYDEEEE